MSEVEVDTKTGKMVGFQARSVVGGVYYSLTKSLTLVGEYIDTKADAWNGDSAHEHDFALGGILFF